MGAGSLLSFMARHSSFLVRQPSKLNPADIALVDYERPSHVNHAHLAEDPDQQPHPSERSLHQLLGSFQVDLVERLQQLQLQGSGNAHLNWLLDAFSSTLSTHSLLQSALTAAAASIGDASLAQSRADAVLPLLDVCTAVKQVVDDVDRHVGCLQHRLESVGQALISNPCLPSGRLHAAAHRLSMSLFQEQGHTGITDKRYRLLEEARSSLLLAAKHRDLQGATTPEAALLNQAIDGTLLTSLLALAAAVSSLEPQPPRKCTGTLTRVCKVISRYSSAKSLGTPAWAAPLHQLCQDLREEEVSAGGSLFQELTGLHSAATKLHATIITPKTHAIEVIGAKQSVESLTKSLQEVQLCTSVLRTQLTTFFQALIRLRLTLLHA